MKIAVVLGTRPEIIKLSPFIKLLRDKRADFFVLHTGQHYSYELDRIFFDQLELPQPGYNIDVGSGSHGEETGKMLIGIEPILLNEKPDVIAVEGDTNSVLAGALAGAKLGIKIAHIEAGLRSYDRTMPEEINRILTDHISDYLFPPTPEAEKILLGEGIEAGRITVTGNTIVDAVYQNLELAKNNSRILEKLGLEPGRYCLATMHRQENVDNRERFAAALDGLRRVSEHYSLPVIYPVHPRSRKKMKEFRLEPAGLRVIEPVDFLDFLLLESSTALVLTDSGGVQEETCILRVPCVTIRDNTERPETVTAGGNILAGATAENILKCAGEMLGREKNWNNPFGDGTACARIYGTITAAGP